MEKGKVSSPVYQRIALDIAEKIINGQYLAGQKIYGRSILAGHYKVSPETIRRATFLLQDLGIVEVTQGSGITIKSTENAGIFIKRFREVRDMSDIRQEVMSVLEEQEKCNRALSDHIRRLMEYVETYRSLTTVMPFEIKITDQCTYLGKMISEVNFWQNTGATIIAIRRGDEMVLSPGPYANFTEGDVFLMIGSEGVLKKATDFLYE